MVDRAIKTRTPFAASPATDEADLALLSRMAALAEALAAGFQAQGVAALKAGDLDRAGKAEGGFSNLFLGIRRAIALKARLRQQREETRRKAEAHKDRRQDQKDRRRHAVAERMSRAIAAGKPEARERLTTELWERLTEDDRIDADLADTALPIETLVQWLGREIGVSRRALAAALDPNGPKADPAGAGPKPWDEIPGHAAANPPPPPRRYDYTPGTYRTIPAADLGLPGDEIYNLNTTTGEIFAPGGKLFRKLDDRPPDPGGAGPPAAAGPPDPQPPLDPEEAEFQRQAAYAKRHGIMLLRPPALARRLGLPEHGTADGGPGPGNRSVADKGP
ncbi:hypothetical protein [Inquilinus sp. CA228]|uniref:hypothetical protein n=1 Tax=Inquilinus sp. CA228 TaxID=3455609 RepID=UPI003F8D12A4